MIFRTRIIPSHNRRSAKLRCSVHRRISYAFTKLDRKKKLCHTKNCTEWQKQPCRPSKTQDIGNYQYMMEHMTLHFLRLMVLANGHAFVASAFHVLRLCTGMRRLMLQTLVATGSEVNLFFVCLILSPDTKKVAFWFLKGIFDSKFLLQYISKAKLN
jgi:hypothetical protein